MSADPSSASCICPSRCPSSDYNGFNRPGDGLFGESLVAVDMRTGKRRWHYQTVHHGLWDCDLPCAPMLFDMQQTGRTIKALAQPTKQAFLFVLNRETGEPIWPIEERPVPQSESPFEKTSPTQPFPTRPQPFDRQGFSADVLNDLHAGAARRGRESHGAVPIGPMFTPPAIDRPGGPLGTLMLPADVGGANWPGGSFDPETTACTFTRIRRSSRCRTSPPISHRSTRARLRAQAPPGGGRRRRRRQAVASVRDPAHWERNRGQGGPRASTFLQGTIPLIKPPYDRITAYDMNTGEMLWQKAHSTTPDNIRNNPALAGLDASRLGAYGRIFIGTLTTKTLVIAGEGDVHTERAARRWRCCALTTRRPARTSAGKVVMPAKQTGSPMTYLHNGKQYILVAVSQSGVNAGAD